MTFTRLTKPPWLDASKFEAVWHERRGLVPAWIDGTKGEVSWIDLRKYHIYEGFYRTGKDSYRAMVQLTGSRDDLFEFRTSLASLSVPVATTRLVAPSAFIFHASRCGSTLLTRALARSTNIISIGEPGFAGALMATPPAKVKEGSHQSTCAMRSVRQAYNLLGRQRVDAYRHYVVKMTAAETVFIPVMRKLYPDTPFLYLFRDPVEIMASLLTRSSSVVKTRGTAAGDRFAGQPSSGLSHNRFLNALLTHNMRSALAASNLGLKYLSYEQLSSSVLKSLLGFFRIEVANHHRQLMMDEFNYYSKAFAKHSPFEPDGVRKRAQLGEEMFALIQGQSGEVYRALLEKSDLPTS